MERGTNPGKILIVDDEAAVRRVLKKTLESNGYNCTAAADASEARRGLEQQDFDLLLCDIRMPGESGLDLIRYVAPQYPDTAIIMVTGIDDPVEAKIAREIGIYGYILKPFDPNQILISVANALRRRELEMQATSYRQNLEEIVKQRTAELLDRNATLQKREAELKTQAKELEEVNNALRVLLKKREQDQAALEESILANVKKTIEPYLERLKRGRLNAEQHACLSIIAENINDIVSPFIKELSSSYLSLSPTELQVVNLIKQGKRTKEIAAILNLSANTVMSHRYKIRSKLGLLKKKTNLYTFLQSLR
ncbi:MAG: response regulator [Desulfobacterales bacterium]|uniref:Response regulator n=1 Tax=Candidatus Desulfatibia vada TaxID=2841696 RepID=A0A8J6NSW7_9BACT|nr:response regulator [Candidatus Desulfatibia vada]